MAAGSSKAVYTAIVGNFIVMVGKFAAFFVSGSAAMLSEGIHSFADVSNQCLLALGIERSKKSPDKRHPYGYVRERYIWALISAVGIFFLGCGVTIYHGITTLIHPQQIDQFSIAFYVLIFAFIIEGYTLVVAVKAVNEEAKNLDVSFWDYMKNGTDPLGVAVVLEDSAAVIGVLLAAAGLGLSYWTKDPIWDSVATISIGVLLGFVAIFIAYRTKSLLVGQAIPAATLKKILDILNADPIVEKVLEIKTAIMGVDDLRFKAEIEFNGEVIAKRFLDSGKSDTEELDLSDPNSKVVFLEKFGEHLIELLGDEIDRMEKQIKTALPNIKYIDLEVN